MASIRGEEAHQEGEIMRCRRSILSVLVLLSFAATQSPAEEPKPDYSRGQKMLDAYFRRRVQQISDDCLKDIRTKEEWEKRRPEYRRQFLDMIGLWPLPPRSDLKATITGKIESDKFTVEKLHFQSMPGLYVTANLYVPKNAKSLPTVLYVCGHGNIVKDGVSYGSKVFYQHHPAWLTENGYVCLILDTLELGEIPGEHHGTSSKGMWWWQAAGYTPAGIECWNAMRALDYLETRPEVDPKRLAVTGRSGGGATSWWLAAADDRPQCIIPVAGITDLYSHLIEGELEPYRKGGVIAGHCDCMYMVNTYQWDFPLVAALCAPRPLMLGNSDADSIFPLGGVRLLAEKVRRIYDLYGAGDKFTVLETSGPHKDTPELRLGAFRWLNHWLKNDNGPVVEKERTPFTPQELKVLDHVQADAINEKVHERWTWSHGSQEAEFRGPEIPKDWPKTKQQWLDVLKEKVFRNWPKEPPKLNVHLAADIKKDDKRLRAWDFMSEDDVELRIYLLTDIGTDVPKSINLRVADERFWREFANGLGQDFAQAFPGTKLPESPKPGIRNRFALTVDAKFVGQAIIAPRGIGMTRWAQQSSKEDILTRRRFAWIGQTLEGQQVWDFRRACAALHGLFDPKKTRISLLGNHEMASIALHAAVFESDIEEIRLVALPESYRTGPVYLNVLRYFDVPQALALAFPKKVELFYGGGYVWSWPEQLQNSLGKKYLNTLTFGE
jgi:dienelactone hydrolase